MNSLVLKNNIYDMLNHNIDGREYGKVSIISPFPKDDIDKPTFGGSSLIQLQKIYFDKRNFDIHMIYLPEIRSTTSYILNFISKIRKSPKKQIRQNASKRWLSNLLFWIFVDILSRFDISLKKELTNVLENSKSKVVLCNYPIFYDLLFSICKKREITCILFEHNVEYFFYEQMLAKSKLVNIFINILKRMECSAIKKSDLVLVVTPKDREILLNDIGRIYEHKIICWIPFDHKKEIYTKEKIIDILKSASVEDKKFADNIKGKVIIGFAGAHFEPNIISVENIIKIARNVEDKTTFLILGTVCNGFNDRKDMSNNVIMKGFVHDLDFYLSICDTFINPKITSDTGIEIKMFDYLKFGKPIISTEIGARGFEKFGNIIISDIDKMDTKFKKFVRN